MADGGYLDDRLVSGTTLTFDNPITSLVIGYKYKGVIKSFCLGFQVQGQNTQTTFKAINRAGIRTTASAGGMFGSSLYRMEPVQDLSQNDLNYLPPRPIDGTKYIGFVDDNKLDKYFYIAQKEPLPFHVCAVMLEANYAVAS